MSKIYKSTTILGIFKPDSFIENVYKYIDTRFELAKLDTEERLTRISMRMFELAIVITLLSTFVLFANIALALYLDEFFGKPFMGFLMVALIQIFFLVLVLLSRWILPRRMRNGIRNIFYRIVKYIFFKENK